MSMPKRLLLMTLALMFAAAAEGHAKLRASVPAADAQLAAPPKTLTLTFSESARIAVLTLATQGKPIALKFDRAAAAAAEVSIALPELAPGTYQVTWSAISADDGHVSKGSFSFSVGAPAAVH
jgi:methionine-rich copper-binding protein CopC